MKDMSLPQAFESCPSTGKRVYVTRAKAMATVPRIARKNKRSGDRCPIHAYRCPSCDCWHIGHVQPLTAVRDRPRCRSARPSKSATERAMDHVIKRWWSLEMQFADRAKG